MSTIENFTIKIPNSVKYRPNLKPLIISILLSCILTYPIMGFSNNAIFCNILLFVTFFIILSSLSNENMSNELPSTLYPSSPHMGLDGISLNTYISGNDNNINSKFGNY
jgi:hypothetical protein